MTTEQKQVKEFMQVFGQETPKKPCEPSLEVRVLRAKLILEECLEVISALGFRVVQMSGGSFRVAPSIDGDVEWCGLSLVADGLADLHYVAYCGTATACGLDMEPIFAEVHRSNMTKLWTEDEVIDAKCTNMETAGLEHLLYNKVGDRWLVKNKDGKVIKSPSHSPANLQPLIDTQSK